MSRITKLALTGALALCLSGLLAVAANSAPAAEKAPAKVQDLVKAIATAKKMNPAEVETFLRNGGLKFDLNSDLRGDLAASMLAQLGLNVRSTGDMLVSDSQVSRLGMVASYGSFTLNAEDECDASLGQVCNRGKKLRKGGNQPNSNANVNAFESLRDDPRD